MAACGGCSPDTRAELAVTVARRGSFFLLWSLGSSDREDNLPHQRGEVWTSGTIFLVRESESAVLDFGDSLPSQRGQACTSGTIFLVRVRRLGPRGQCSQLERAGLDFRDSLPSQGEEAWTLGTIFPVREGRPGLWGQSSQSERGGSDFGDSLPSQGLQGQFFQSERRGQNKGE